MRQSAKHQLHVTLNSDSIDASNWPELFASLSDPRFYHHPDWYLAIDQHLMPGSIQLASCRDANQTLALLPWVSDGHGRRLCAPKHDHLSLGDVLLNPELCPAEAQCLVEAILAQCANNHWDYQLANLPSRSSMYSAFKCHPQWQTRQTRLSAWFDLSAVDCPPGGKLRRNLKRLRSKLETTAETRVDWFTQAPQIEQAFDHFIELEASGWKGSSGKSTAIAHNPELLGFYRQLLAPTYPGLQPVVTLLWSGDICIAAQLGMITGSTLSLLKIAYSEEYAAYSPGSLLLQSVMNHAIDQKLQTLSLVTCPPWADRWHPQTEAVWHATGFANGPGGTALQTLYRLKQLARNTLKPGS